MRHDHHDFSLCEAGHHVSFKQFIILSLIGGMIFLFGITIELAQAEPPFRVNTIMDAPDNNKGDGHCRIGEEEVEEEEDSLCSLRAAIEELNAWEGVSERIIQIPPDTYELDPVLGELHIESDMELRGELSGTSVPKVSLPDGARSRILKIGCREEICHPIVRISRLWFEKGNLRSFSDGGGAGIYVRKGSTVTLFRTRISENKSWTMGGGIRNAGTLYLAQSRVDHNYITSTTPCGGGVQSGGGGINNLLDAQLYINQTSIDSNDALYGGGIYNGGFLQIKNSTISGNRVLLHGGGILNLSSGTARISFTTITNNEAGGRISNDRFCNDRHRVEDGEEFNAQEGGGVYNLGSMLLGNSILAGNLDHHDKRTQDGRTIDSDHPDCYTKFWMDENGQPRGHITNFGGNLIGVWPSTISSCFMRSREGIPTLPPLRGTLREALDPKLEALAPFDSPLDSPTPHHALQADSPAIDTAFQAGPPDTGFFDCPHVDQRGGFRRHEDVFISRHIIVNAVPYSPCDIGAYEYNSNPEKVALLDQLLRPLEIVNFDLTNAPQWPGGIIHLKAVYINTSQTPIHTLSFDVVDISGDSVILNAEKGSRGRGSTVRPALGHQGVVLPGGKITVELKIGRKAKGLPRLAVKPYGIAYDTKVRVNTSLTPQDQRDLKIAP